MDNLAVLGSEHDLLPDLVGVVRDAIAQGLITSTSLDRFDYLVETMEGPELEDYLQTLWDRL